MASKVQRECPDCGGIDFVESHSCGDIVCTGCALVVTAHSRDESSEWRNFADNDKNTADPSRVGAVQNSLLDSSTAAATRINDGGRGGGFSNMERLHARSNTQDRALLQAFGAIGLLCERIGLKDNVRHRACELYKQIIEADKSVKSRPGAALHASCIFLACRQEGHPRTFNEIVPIANASKKDIGRCYKLLVAKLGVDAKDMSVVHASHYLRRFCNHLEMNNTDIKAVTAIVDVACPKDGNTGTLNNTWDGKSPISVAAAVIYMVSLLPKASKAPTLQEISNVSRVAEGTIKTAYKDLYPERRRLVPSWFASTTEIDALPDPLTKA